MRSGAPKLAGWALVGWTTLLVTAWTLALLLAHGSGEEFVRAVLRVTARLSLVLFLAVFVASSAHRLWRSRETRWLLANRRYLGVSFAVSHAVHFTAIVTLVRTTSFEVDSVTLIAGGFGFVFIAAMAATSFDRTAAWLGRRAWKALHTTGIYYLWFIFTFTLLDNAKQSVAARAAVGALLIALGFRLGVRFLTRTGAAARWPASESS